MQNREISTSQGCDNGGAVRNTCTHYFLTQIILPSKVFKKYCVPVYDNNVYPTNTQITRKTNKEK